jgi:hypothetical protein
MCARRSISISIGVAGYVSKLRSDSVRLLRGDVYTIQYSTVSRRHRHRSSFKFFSSMSIITIIIDAWHDAVDLRCSVMYARDEYRRWVLVLYAPIYQRYSIYKHLSIAKVGAVTLCNIAGSSSSHLKLLYTERTMSEYSIVRCSRSIRRTRHTYRVRTYAPRGSRSLDK